MMNTLDHKHVEASVEKLWNALLGTTHIGPDDDFFDLGGDSLTGLKLLTGTKEAMQCDISFSELFKYATFEAFCRLVKEKRAGERKRVLFEKVNDHGNIPLSFPQERLWFIDRLSGSTQYHIPIAFNIKGSLSVTRLEKAFSVLFQKHAILRTRIGQQGGVPFQEISNRKFDGIQIIKATTENIDAFLASVITLPFDLNTDQLLRVYLFERSENDWILLLVIHHIVADGWSLGIIYREISALYNDALNSENESLPYADFQYADFAVWQRKRYKENALQGQLQFWKTNLAGYSKTVIPTDYNRPVNFGTNGGVTEFTIAAEELKQLKKITREQGATLFMTMLSSFMVLLYRYTGNVDICVGTPVSGRLYKETEHMIGFFANLVPVRTKINPAQSFDELVQQVKRSALAAFENQEPGFEQIVNAIEPARDTSAHPMFQLLFSFDNLGTDGTLEIKDTVITDYLLHVGYTQFDFSLDLRECQDGLKGIIGYGTDLFKAATIDRLVAHFKFLVKEICSNSGQGVNMLSMFGESDLKKMLQQFNPVCQEPSGQTLVEIFEKNAGLYPEHVALRVNDQALSYADLNKEANALAHRLIAIGVLPGDYVPLCTNRSAEMIIGILGVLKSGAAYVPIDPAYPENRKSFIVHECNAAVVIVTKKVKEHFPPLNCQILSVEEALQKNAGHYHNPGIPIRAAMPAYIIFTSGTTGQPKGVVVLHKNVVSLFEATETCFLFQQTDNWTLFHSFCFDFSVWEIFGALLYAACLIIVPEEATTDPRKFADFIAAEKVTVLSQTPQAFYSLSDEMLSRYTEIPVRYVIFGGESLNFKKLSGWMTAYSPGCRLINMYGITETTVHVTFLEVTTAHLPENRIVVGTPLSFANVYILDQDKMVVPPGVTGELYISGSGVAKGYLNNDALTGERFLDLPPHLNGEKMYRSGDLGRWLDDGTIIISGRADDQVKIRGYRIELKEIENTLLKYSSIDKAFVMPVTLTGENIQLGAFVVMKTGVAHNPEELAAFLQQYLPAYMIPSWFECLTYLPVTANGKIDKDTLIQLRTQKLNEQQSNYQPPANETERLLAVLWEQLLETKPISTQANFFEIGGHSLLIVKLAVLIEQELKTAITIRDLFTYPTIRSLAKYVAEHAAKVTGDNQNNYSRLTKAQLGFTQERLWFIDQLEGSVKYHVPYIARLKGAVNIKALEYAFHKISERHDILRTVFKEQGGQVFQYVDEALATDFQVLDISSTIDAGEFLQLKNDLLNQPFHLSESPSMRVRIFDQANQGCVLLIVMHHIITDGWSYNILLKELAHFYQQFSDTTLPGLPLPAMQYCNYAEWSRNEANSAKIANDLAYWKALLAGTQSLELPKDMTYLPVQSGRGAFYEAEIQEDLKQRLQQVSSKNDTTLFMTLLAAFKVLLYRYSHQTDICIGTPVAERSLGATANTIGCFINTVVLRSNLEGNPHFSKFLQSVKETVLESCEHQAVPFEKVVEALVKERDMSRTPLFQVMFSMENITTNDVLKLGGLEVLTEPLEITTTQFELNLYIRNEPGRLHLLLSYAVDLYKETTVARLIKHYVEILQSICDDTEQPVAAVNMLPAAERTFMLYDFNDTLTSYPLTTIHSLFEEKAAMSPEAVALCQHGENMCYGELNRLSNRLAHSLINAGVKPGDSIGLTVTRSFDMIIGMLGILKAGGAYVPIDPDYPSERQVYIMRQSGINILLTDDAALLAAQVDGIQTILLAKAIELSKRDSNPEVPVHFSQLAYTIYTSGSTGLPKGVMIAHHSAVNLIEWVNQTFSVGSNDRLLFITSMSFDLSVYDIFGILAAGGTVVIASKKEVNDIDLLRKLVQTEKITFWDSVPSTLNYLVEELKRDAQPSIQNSLRLVFLSGDWIPVQLPPMVKTFFPNAQVVGLGGATEATVWSNYYLVEEDSSNYRSIPYGKPIDNNFFYILDDYLQPVPTGVAGELYIGGVGVALGYANDIEKTGRGFLNDPFNTKAGGRMYRTGDRGRMLEDGNMEFLGRKDNQVKIRGFRVETGEIDSVMMKSSLVEQAVTIVKTDERGVQMLVTFVVPIAAATFNASAVLEYASQWLPQYMLPAFVLPLQEMPLNSNGKIHKQALAGIELSQGSSQPKTAPSSFMSKKLQQIWKHLLDVAEVGLDQSFFELGGHSLMATKLISVVRTEIGVSLTIRDIFQNTTLDKMARLLELKQFTADTVLEKAPEGSIFALSEGQRGIWLEEQFAGPQSSIFNVVDTIDFNLGVDAQLVKAAINVLIERHEILRTTVAVMNAEPVFQTHTDWEFHLPQTVVETDLEFHTAVDKTFAACCNRVLSGGTWPLFHMHLVKAPHRACLVIAVHHIITDARSMEIMKDEIANCYGMLESGTLQVDAPVRWQYRDYIHTVNKLGTKASHKQYWMDTFLQPIPRANLFSPVRQNTRSYDAACYVSTIEKGAALALKKIAQKEDVTIFTVLLTAVNLLLHHLSEEKVIVTGIPYSNRELPEVQDMLGFFVNTLAIVNTVSPQENFEYHLCHIKKRVAEAIEHKAYAFGELVKALGMERDTSRHPLFDIMVNYEQKSTAENVSASEPAEIRRGWKVKYDMMINFVEEKEFKVMIIYNTSIFADKTIILFKDYLDNMINTIIGFPGSAVQTLFEKAFRQDELALQFIKNDFE